MSVTSIKQKMIIVALLCAFFIQSYVSLSSKSATFDEVQYFGIGKYLIKHQKWDVMGSVLHPPLSYYISSIPLLFIDEDEQLWEYGDVERNLEFLGMVDYYRGQALLSSVQNANDILLITSRLMIVLLSILLGYYVYRFSCDLFGVKSGILSLTLFTFCPNMLAFSGICVPDMPLTVFSFISVYYLWVCLKDKTWVNVSLAGLFLGLALLTKFTAMLLIPIELVLCLAYLKKEKQKVLSTFLVVVCIATLIMFTGYGFNIIPFLQGNELRLSQVQEGQSTFLMGEHSMHGWWYYYPIAFLLKTPIPLILLLLISIVVYLKNSINRWLELTFLLLPIVTFLCVFSASYYCLALRYILPIYPFIFVIIGSLAVYGGRFKYLIYLMFFWYIGSSLYIAPHYLAYFNETIGGPDNGYKYLVDGNLDWGQDLKGLKKYMDEKGIDRISLSYFGADAPQRYGIKYDWLPSFYLYNPEPEKPVSIPSNQLIAISATNLQGLYLGKQDEFKWLLQHEPVAKIGYSIFVYDLGKQNIIK